MLRAIIVSLGVQTAKNPAFWLVRGIAWAVFGVAGGLVYGLVDRSGRKTKYGIIGGLIGAGLGGTIFDPISFATKTGDTSVVVLVLRCSVWPLVLRLALWKALSKTAGFMWRRGRWQGSNSSFISR